MNSVLVRVRSARVREALLEAWISVFDAHRGPDGADVAAHMADDAVGRALVPPTARRRVRPYPRAA